MLGLCWPREWGVGGVWDIGRLLAWVSQGTLDMRMASLSHPPSMVHERLWSGERTKRSHDNARPGLPGKGLACLASLPLQQPHRASSRVGPTAGLVEGCLRPAG